MTQIFKINEQWSVVRDSENSILTKVETKTRKKKFSEETEEYESKSEYFYPSLYTALEKYVLVVQDDATDVIDCIRITKEAIQTIKSLSFE